MPSITTLLKRRNTFLPIQNSDGALQPVARAFDQYMVQATSPVVNSSLASALRLNSALRMLDLSLSADHQAIALSIARQSYFCLRPSVPQMLELKEAIQKAAHSVAPAQAYLCEEEVGRAMSVLDFAIERIQVRTQRSNWNYNTFTTAFGALDTTTQDALDDVIAALAAHRRQRKNEQEGEVN